ncbi:MAG: hypothetical protein AAB227_12420 [Pseudomonadota bacterium]
MQIRQGIVYNSFKYTMFALLAIDIALFYELNSAAEGFTFKNGVTIGDFIVAYADAIDAFAWVGLLVMFEIETSYEPPERYRKWATPLIGAVTLLFWAAIVYSFYGYAGGLEFVNGFAASAAADPCALAGTDASFANSLNDYAPLDAANCASLGAGAYYNADVNMFASADALSMIKRLTWTDVVNAGVWIVLGALIEFEIFLRVTRRATPKILKTLHLAQIPFWTVLVVDVFYWWALGEPLDAWDAFLWIACFFFIELNMMAKHEENARRHAKEISA